MPTTHDDTTTQLDRRRTPGLRGRGPDVDSVDALIAHDYAHREDAFRHSEIGGFWKRAEYLACRRGDKMRALDMVALFGGPTWQRARAASNQRKI